LESTAWLQIPRVVLTLLCRIIEETVFTSTPLETSQLAKLCHRLCHPQRLIGFLAPQIVSFGDFPEAGFGGLWRKLQPGENCNPVMLKCHDYNAAARQLAARSCSVPEATAIPPLIASGDSGSERGAVDCPVEPVFAKELGRMLSAHGTVAAEQ
jgi:hypothetical protein